MNSNIKNWRNSFGLIFLIIPIGSIIWIQKTGYTFPINHSQLMLLGVPILVSTFSLFWQIAYGADKKDKSLILTTLFFLLLWFTSGFFLLAKINSSFSSDELKSYYRLVTEIRYIAPAGSSAKGNPGRAGRSCQVNIKPSLAGTEVLNLSANLCDSLRAGEDGIELKISSGLFMPWVVDYAIIKDFIIYQSKVNINSAEDLGW